MLTIRDARVRWGLWALAVGLMLLGCVTPDDEGGVVNVSGQVQGDSFGGSGGVADGLGGEYVITLSSESGYTCSTTPAVDYLTVVLGQIDGPGTFSASGNVSFNVIEGQSTFTEAATSGSIVIDELDAAQGFIRGSINARGPESDVSGSFDVSICN
jgi:hypothetical protein